MGIIVNLADRTVQGFGHPFDLRPLEIGYVNDIQPPPLVVPRGAFAVSGKAAH